MIAQDEDPARPRWPPEAAALGLAGGVLGELELADCLVLDEDGRLAMAEDANPPDVLTAAVLDQMHAAREPGTVAAWLHHLTREVADAVVERLERAGRVHREVRETHGLPIEEVVPDDAHDSGWAAARLSLSLARRHPMTDDLVLLAGLVAATGLDRHLDVPDREGAATHLRGLVGRLAPPRRALLATVETEIAQAVLSHRG